jgi:hypothetical protein
MSWMPVLVSRYIEEYEGEAMQDVCESCHARLTGVDFYGHRKRVEERPCINGHAIPFDHPKNEDRHYFWLHCPECKQEGQKLIVPLLRDRWIRTLKDREEARLEIEERKRLQRQAGAVEEDEPAGIYYDEPEPEPEPEPEQPAQMSLF